MISANLTFERFRPRKEYFVYTHTFGQTVNILTASSVVAMTNKLIKYSYMSDASYSTKICQFSYSLDAVWVSDEDKKFSVYSVPGIYDQNGGFSFIISLGQSFQIIVSRPLSFFCFLLVFQRLSGSPISVLSWQCPLNYFKCLYLVTSFDF